MSGYMSEQLENFAKALDKRLPNAAMIEDYNRKLAELEKKVDSIGSTKSTGTKIERVRSPDITKLAARVALLEKRLTELIALMKGFSSRMPVVVE